MSKIQKELCEAAETDPKRGEDRQDFLLRLALAVNKLPDSEWNKLGKEAQSWVNDASDAANAKKELPDFSDAEKAESGSSRRRVSQEDAAPAPYEPKLKDDVKATTKRGKIVTGKIVEMDKDIIVLKLVDGGEEELNRDRIEKIEPLGGSKDPAEEGPRDPKVGDTVTVTTKRDKVVTGEVVEMDKDIIVLKLVDGGEEEFMRDRIASIKVEGGRRAESGSTGRRSADSSKDNEGKGDEKPAAEDGKRTRATNAGVSVGTRVRELIIENMDAKLEDISKMLKKENLEFRENTVQLNYADAHKLLDMLKKRKMLK